MKILIAFKGVIPVTYYGGTQRVIWYLGQELVRLGHSVTYLVSRGSHCPFGRVIEIDETRPVEQQIPNDVDLIHFNFLPAEVSSLPKPYVITMHGNLNDDTRDLDPNVIFVSRNHADRFGSQSFVYNGLDWDDYLKPDLGRHRTYFHFLGNAAWRIKNVTGAIRVVLNTPSHQLHVLGGRRFNFRMGIRLTFSPRVRFHPQVGGELKCRLLNGSHGLVFPVRWHEPFGLAIIESLFYGCPVFGTPYGSLPELVHKDVGYLSDKAADLTVAIQNVDHYSRKLCHDYSVTEFNSRKMALNYLKKYETVLAGQPLNPTRPRRIKSTAERFLNWVE